MVVDAVEIFVARRRQVVEERQEKALAFYRKLEELRDRVALERKEETRA